MSATVYFIILGGATLGVIGIIFMSHVLELHEELAYYKHRVAELEDDNKILVDDILETDIVKHAEWQRDKYMRRYNELVEEYNKYRENTADLADRLDAANELLRATQMPGHMYKYKVS